MAISAVGATMKTTLSPLIKSIENLTPRWLRRAGVMLLIMGLTGIGYAIGAVEMPVSIQGLLCLSAVAILIGGLSVGYRCRAANNSEADWQRLAHHDELTALLNRRGFYAVAEQKILRTPCVLILFDIQQLKYINDQQGHAVGDACLQYFAELLKQTVRHSDVVCRFGGDEFAVLLENADSNVGQQLLKRLEHRVTTFNTSLNPTFTPKFTPVFDPTLQGNTKPVYPTLAWHVGLATIPIGGSLSQALQRADTALIQEKSRSKSVDMLKSAELP